MTSNRRMEVNRLPPWLVDFLMLAAAIVGATVISWTIRGCPPHP